MFSDKKLSKSLEFYYLEPCLSTSITDIVEAINTVFQEKDHHSEIYVTVEVCRRTQKVRFTLEMKGQVVHSLVRTWDTFSEVMLIMNMD